MDLTAAAAPPVVKPSEDAPAVAKPPDAAAGTENSNPKPSDGDPPAAAATNTHAEQTPEPPVNPPVAPNGVAVTGRAWPPPSSQPVASNQAVSPTQPVSPALVAVLLARGDALLATGDVVAARLMYQRVAGSDSGPAALAMGMTYDPRFLASIGAQGLAADPQQAIFWYKRAAGLGSSVAPQMLAKLEDVMGN
jgi:TPR repeat protein